MAKDFVHDAGKRLGCIDDDAAAGYVFFRSMQSRDAFLFLWFSAPVRWVARHTLIQPSVQGVQAVDFKNKNAVQYMDEFCKVPRTAAEERNCLAVIGDHGFNFVYSP